MRTRVLINSIKIIFEIIQFYNALRVNLIFFFEFFIKDILIFGIKIIFLNNLRLLN